jgi:hypothetical protein
MQRLIAARSANAIATESPLPDRPGPPADPQTTMEYQQYATLHYFVERHNHSAANLREADIMRDAVANWSARLDHAAWLRLLARLHRLVARLRHPLARHPRHAVAA